MRSIQPWLSPASITFELLSLGSMLYCGFLSLVIEDWFKCSYALWMIGAALVFLMISAVARRLGRSGGHVLRLERPTRADWPLRRARLLWVAGLLMLSWWVIEWLAFHRVYHYAYAWSLRDPLWLAAAPMMLTALGCGAAAMRARRDRPLWRVQDLPARLLIDSGVAGTAAFILMQPVKPVPATRHFNLPEVLAGLLVLSLTFVALDWLRIVKKGGAIQAEAKRLYLKDELGRFIAWFLVVGHLLPILMVSRQLPAFDLLAAVAALIGLAHGHRLLLSRPQAHDSAEDFP